MANGLSAEPARAFPQAENSYSPEAVQSILSHALELQATAATSFEQLQEMAADLNIAPEVLTVAEQNWRSHQAEIAQQTEQLQKQQHQHYQAWIQYGLGSALLIGINVATAGTITWAVFPVLGWGLGVCLDQCDRDAANVKNDSANVRSV
ncbi:MAG: 2TM domain-containing protein [Leptolyngbya sp. SIO1D8]|nr:2TM domain-containing protein [Leptolyngbya sp. SIO1D8]